MTTSTTRTLFAAIGAGDSTAIRGVLDTDPGLVYARQDVPNEGLCTPLQLAAHLGNLDICRLLVDCGAEVYTNPMNTYSPVAMAAWKKHQNVVDYFLKEIPDKADGTNKLGIAINLAGRFGWAEIVRKHIQADPLSVHQRGWIGDSPLHWPSHNNNVEIVAMLLDAGADIEADETNCYGGKPLHWASEHAPKTVELLLARGANVNARNIKADSSFFGVTPLIMNATQRDDCSEVTRLLLAAGADVGATDASGKTAMDWAKQAGLPRIQEALAQHGA